MSVETLRSEHDAVLQTLEARASTRHFAHAAVSFFFSVSVAGTAGKVWWDYAVEEPTWWKVAAALAGAIFTYSVTRAVLGVKSYRSERVQVDRLLSLRKQIGLDAPLQLS